MKTKLTLILLILVTSTGYGQKFKEWFRQKKTQKKYLIEQIAYYKIYLELIEKGYNIAREGLTTISDLKESEFKLHKNRFDSLSIVKASIKKYPAASATVDQIRGAIILYWQIGDLLSGSQWLKQEEKKYVYSVFDQLMADGVGILDELSDVTKNGILSMPDDQRIARINSLYSQAKEIYAFARQLCSESAVLSSQRINEMGDIDNRRILYEIK